MRAVIVAAGRGSRLGELTRSKPKCLVNFNGRSLIERSVMTLRNAGVRNIAVVSGYQKDHLSTFADVMFENPDWAETGVVWSLERADLWLKSYPCLVVYGDIFFGGRLIEELVGRAEDLVLPFDPDALSLWNERMADPVSDLETFRIASDGRLLEIGAKIVDATLLDGQFMGLLKTTPQGWGALQAVLDQLDMAARRKIDMTSLLSRALDDDVRIMTARNREPWGEIDNPSDIAVYERLYPTT